MKIVNTAYYRTLLDQTVLPPSKEEYYRKVLATIDKQGGTASSRQQNILFQIKAGT